jgi:hypothetical protein
MTNSPAPQDSTDDVTPLDPPRRRGRTELIYAAIGIGSGLIALPFLIYLVGILLIGPYAGGRGLGAFLAQYYGNLLSGELRTWFIALSPYIAIWVIRLGFRPWSSARSNPTDSPRHEETAQALPSPGRREPFIGT